MRNNYCKWYQLRFLKNVVFTGICWMGLQTNVFALPFGVYDSRTMAMGGVGVATGTNNAAFNNPALITTADEIHEWFLILPTASQQLDDADDLKDELKTLKQAANTLDATNNVANRNAVQASLDAIDGSHYSQTNNIALMLAIPSRILSGAIFLNSYDISNIQPVIGGDDLLVPTYNSTLSHRGVRVIENGVSAAKVLDANYGWLRDISIGFSAKFLLIKTFAYSEAIRSSEVKLETSQGNNNSQFALDLGIFKEFGVWKLGLTAKNLIPGSYSYGATNEEFKIEPQLRAGFAYQSRFSAIEINLDLTENESVGYDSATRIAAIGWEWYPIRNLAFRTGYSKNLVNPESGSSSPGKASAGIGLLFSGFHFDVAGYTSNRDTGISGQLGLQF